MQTFLYLSFLNKPKNVTQENNSQANMFNGKYIFKGIGQ